MSKSYDPLDYGNLTINLVRELMARDAVNLPIEGSFAGPGVYALFYQGDFAPYSRVASVDSRIPIYVGKAVPPGARKGGRGDETYPALFKRVKEHSSSIDQAYNLELSHFRCRYLTVVPLWITMAERFLIEHYQPLWNLCIEGFGLHDPGKGRHRGEVSWWDTLHPGRSWATNLNARRAEADALARLEDFMRSRQFSSETP